MSVFACCCRQQCQYLEFSSKTAKLQNVLKYSITCIQRPLKESNESGLLQQVVFKCRLYQVDLRRVAVSGVAVSGQWSLKAGGLLIQVVSKTGLTVLCLQNMCFSSKCCARFFF